MPKNAPCTPAEWEAILTSLFRHEPLGDIQATADVQSESSITISIRKRVQGITVSPRARHGRLGIVSGPLHR